jgi:hypothetical protein
MTSTTPSVSLRSIATGAILALGSILPLSCVAAADQPAANNADRMAPVGLRDWSLTVTPYMWASSLNGDAGVKGLHARINVPFRETLKELQFSAMGAAEFRRGNFGAYVNGEYGKVSSDKHVARLTLGVGMKSYLLAAGVYYRVYEAQLGGNTVFGTPRVFAIEPMVGARWTRLTTKVSVDGLGTSGSERWLYPFVGTRLFYDLTNRWNVAVEADIGGFGVGSRLSVNAQSYLGYRTTVLGLPTTLRAGYRVLHQDYRDRGFQWKVTQHGPIVGASVQF